MDRRVRRGLAVAGLLLVVLVLLPVAVVLVPFGGAFAACHHQPIVLMDVLGSRQYHRPDDKGYAPNALAILGNGNGYACSEDEARAMGYHHDISLEPLPAPSGLPS